MKERTSFGQHTLDRQYFVSDEVFAAEHERIFFRSWLLAGHVSQLDQPGSYFLFELEHESVVVLRDREGEIRAFHNHCRHRGSRLCREAQGTLGSAIVCPYHAWAYDLDGTLKNVPAMKEVAGFDAADYPLHRAALANWEGFLFVNLAKEPQPFEQALSGLVGRFRQWQPSELRAADRRIYEVDANWKMFFHNFSECYHCPLAHPQLNKLTAFRNSENDLDEGPVLGGPMWMHNRDGSMTIGGERCAPAFPVSMPMSVRECTITLCSPVRSCRSIPTTSWCIARSRWRRTARASSASGISIQTRWPRPVSMRSPPWISGT